MALANSMIKIGSKVGKGLAKGANAVQKIDDVGVDLIKTKLAREARNAEYIAEHGADTLFTAGEIKDLHRLVGRPEDAQAFIDMLDRDGQLVDESFSQFVKRKISNERYFAQEAINNNSGKIRTARDKIKSIKNIKNNGTSDANLTDIANLTTDEINRASSKYKGDVIEEAIDEVSKKGEKTVSNIKKNALVGSAIGGISGAGIGGITGMATGADEDDMKSMVLLGALSGGAGGATIGAIRKTNVSNISKIAGEIATSGGTNEAVNGGAKKLLRKAGTSVQNFADKIDDIGYTVQHKYTGAKGREASKIISEMQQTGDFETIDKASFIEGLTGGIKRKGAIIGGASQGAIMGSITGATIGGVAGGIDEDETFIGGALKGGFIGGTIGGIGGGASGFINNDAKVLSNTTTNVKSLFS